MLRIHLLPESLPNDQDHWADGARNGSFHRLDAPDRDFYYRLAANERQGDLEIRQEAAIGTLLDTIPLLVPETVLLLATMLVGRELLPWQGAPSRFAGQAVSVLAFLAAAILTPLAFLLLPVITCTLGLELLLTGSRASFRPIVTRGWLLTLTWAVGSGLGYLIQGPAHLEGLAALASPWFGSRWPVNILWLVIMGPLSLLFLSLWRGNLDTATNASRSVPLQRPFFPILTAGWLVFLAGFYRWGMADQILLGQALLAAVLPLSAGLMLWWGWQCPGRQRRAALVLALILSTAWWGLLTRGSPRLVLKTPPELAECTQSLAAGQNLIIEAGVATEWAAAYPWLLSLQGKIRLMGDVSSPKPAGLRAGDLLLLRDREWPPWLVTARRFQAQASVLAVYQPERIPDPVVLLAEEGFSGAVVESQGMFQDGVWTRARCDIHFRGDLRWSRNLIIQLRGWRPPQAPAVEDSLLVTLDGHPLEPQLLQQTYLSFLLPPEVSSSELHHLQLRSGTFVSREFDPSSGDSRALGLDLKGLRFR